MLSFLMMITRRKAMPQVIGFLAMENGLFFAATSATYGMPMVVELGIALDVLVGMLILGVFFFQIREQFDSLDIRHLEKLKENERMIELAPRPRHPARRRASLLALSAHRAWRAGAQRRDQPAAPSLAAGALTVRVIARRPAAGAATSSSSSIRSTCSWSR